MSIGTASAKEAITSEQAQHSRIGTADEPMNKVRRQNRQNSRAEDRERWQSSSIATKRSRSKIQSEGGDYRRVS